MSDEKNDIDTDFEEKLAEIVGKKSRNRTNNNIYERFISRVQGDDDGDNREAQEVTPLDSAEKLFAYEPLSTNELELFTNYDSDETGPLEVADTDTDKATADDDFDFLDQETSIPSSTPNKNKLFKNSHLDKLDDDTLDFDLDDDITHSHQATEPSSTILSETDDIVHERDENDDDHLVPQDPPVPSTVKDVALSQDKLASSKKPLIIGMICGSLLIVIVVMVLIFTGVLSTPMQTAVPDSVSTVSGSKVDTEATTDNTPAGNTAQAPTSPIEQPVAEIQPATPTSETRRAGNGAKVEVANALPAASTVNGTNDLDTDLENGAAITYEDFREESQNTLYRETND